MTADLDTRLRSAGESLTRAATPLSPAGPPRSLRPLASAVVAAVVAVVLATGAVAVLAGDDEGTVSDTATEPATSVPRLVPDVVPEGVRSVGVVEIAPDVPTVSTQSIEVYGDPSADDPFAESDLAIVTTTIPAMFGEEGEAIEVRDHDGVVVDYLPGATTVLWQEREGLVVGVGSRTLDVDQLVAIADGLDIDADARSVEVGEVPDDLPGPLDPVADAEVGTVVLGMHGLGIQGFGLPLGPSTTGHVSGYQPAEYNSFTSATLALYAGDASDLALARWLGGADTPTEVSGRPGWSGSFDLPGFDDGEGIVPGSEGPVSAVVWEEAPGVVAVVHTFGPSLEAAHAMAESLRPTTDDEWSRLVRLGASGDRFRPLDDELRTQAREEQPSLRSPDDAINGAEGVYGDTGIWTTWIERDGRLCGVVAEPGDDAEVDEDGNLVVRSETCDPAGGPATVVSDDAGRPVLVIGVMPDGAVGRIAEGGQVVEIQTVTGPDDGPAYYVMVLADGAVPDTVTFVAADGTDLETVPVGP